MQWVFFCLPVLVWELLEQLLHWQSQKDETVSLRQAVLKQVLWLSPISILLPTLFPLWSISVCWFLFICADSLRYNPFIFFFVHTLLLIIYSIQLDLETSATPSLPQAEEAAPVLWGIPYWSCMPLCSWHPMVWAGTNPQHFCTKSDWGKAIKTPRSWSRGKPTRFCSYLKQ